jgi:hypothetical protein
VAIVNDIRLLLVGLWLGAAMFFSAVVAPSAFSVLRTVHLSNSGEIAGNIVNRPIGHKHQRLHCESVTTADRFYDQKRVWPTVTLCRNNLVGRRGDYHGYRTMGSRGENACSSRGNGIVHRSNGSR